MSIQIVRGRSDEALAQLAGALRPYESAHPAARIELYRQSRFSLRVRIVDPDLAPLDRVDRHNLVWRYFDDLPDDLVSDITMLVLVTPDEMPLSGSSLEFDDPVEQLLL